MLDQRTGSLWSRADLPWLPGVTRLVYHRGLLACEVSTLNDDGPGNELHILSTQDGQVVREFPFLPGMSHMRQARPCLSKTGCGCCRAARMSEGRGFPLEATALDVHSGRSWRTFPAGLAHCFPPVATPRFLLAGEMDFTDLQSGKVDANRITKAACGRDAGWFLAHGLVYVTPKHCVCWPMLRGYAALAPERPGGYPADGDLTKMAWPIETGVALLLGVEVDPLVAAADWPAYRRDAWRSSHTPHAGPHVTVRCGAQPWKRSSPAERADLGRLARGSV